MVGCVAGGMDHPESESRRLEALAERRGGGRRPGAPGDATAQLGVGVPDGEMRHAHSAGPGRERKSTRLNSSHSQNYDAVFRFQKKKSTKRRFARALPPSHSDAA